MFLPFLQALQLPHAFFQIQIYSLWRNAGGGETDVRGTVRGASAEGRAGRAVGKGARGIGGGKRKAPAKDGTRDARQRGAEADGGGSGKKCGVAEKIGENVLLRLCIVRNGRKTDGKMRGRKRTFYISKNEKLFIEQNK